MRGSIVLIALAGCYHPTILEGAPCLVTTDCPTSQVCDLGSCRSMTRPTDGATDADRMGDAPGDGAPATCMQPAGLGAFGAPVLLVTLQALNDDGTPTVTSDLLEMYFKSERALGGQGRGDIWRTTRASPTGMWSLPTNVTALNTSAEEGSPDLSPDRLTIYLSSTRPGGLGGFDLWVASRATTTQAWSAPIHVPELSSAAYEEGFTVLPSGLVGYLHSDRGGGLSQLYRTTRPSTSSAWSAPVLVPGLAGIDDQNPAVTADDCAIYFQSERTGTLGSADLWVATRPTPTAAWGTPANLGPLNSAGFEADPWVSADQRYIVFARTTALGGVDLHEASR